MVKERREGYRSLGRRGGKETKTDPNWIRPGEGSRGVGGKEEDLRNKKGKTGVVGGGGGGGG